jgi:hypothetical protein
MKIRLLSLDDFIAEGHGFELDREKTPPLNAAIPLKSFSNSSEIKIKPYQARDDVLLRIGDATIGYFGVLRCGDAVLDRNNHYDTGFSTQHNIAGFALRRSFFSGYQMGFGDSQVKLQTACYMVAHRNYSSWMLGEVPRLKQYESLMRSGVKLALHGQIRPHHMETLELCGVPPDMIVHVPEEVDLVVSECYFATPTCSYHIPSPAGVRYLRQIMDGMKGPDTFKGGLYYVSRAHAAARKIENETEIHEHLAMKDFITVHPERLCIADQIRLFSTAKTIVTPFGAALANMAFSSLGTEVCVIRTKFTNEFARLAHMTGVRLFVFDSMKRWRHGICFSKLSKELHRRFRINVDDLSRFVLAGAGSKSNGQE